MERWLPVETERLELLANDLSDTGELLIQLADQSRQEALELYSIKEVVATVWLLRKSGAYGR